MIQEAGQMEAPQLMDQWKLIGVLERFADKARESSDQGQDIQAKAYREGKADGLALAGSLLRSISRNGHPDRRLLDPNALYW
jgi:hypothetical protein